MTIQPVAYKLLLNILEIKIISISKFVLIISFKILFDMTIPNEELDPYGYYHLDSFYIVRQFLQ